MREKIIMHALAQKVLTVAVINYKPDDTIFDWTVYIDAVEGFSHETEKYSVARMGSKLSPKIAAIMFPILDIKLFRL